LEALDKRTAEVSYRKEQWFTWVRRVQETQEANREKEQKKVKQEAALFRRHMKTLQARLDMMRQKEEKMRQDAYLEKAYRERMSAEESEDDELWDPIDDIGSDKRNRYIDLIRHFLWIEVLDGGEAAESNTKAETRSAGEGQAPLKKPKKKPKPKAGAPSTSDPGPAGMRGQSKLLDMQEKRQKSIGGQSRELDRSNIETEEEMRKRLKEGVKKNLDNVWGLQVVGTVKNPYETLHETAPMADFEVESVVSDVREIKRLLFSRLLLGQASLLPAALRANSVEEFLNDAGVTETDLRDLCLKVSEPSLQDIRDACADFTRGDDAEEDVEDETDDDDDEDDLEETMEDLIHGAKRYAHLHTDHWLRHKLTGMSLKAVGKETKSTKSPSSRKSKVTICGKSIWNHASEKAMSRDGWLQFSVMAKDCDLKHAIKLCRNWAEFSDLNLLTLWQYFPASNWTAWGRDTMIQQLQELGLFPYFIDFDAEQNSRHFQVGGRGQARRQHDISEWRNVLAGHMKRNDPVSRRFLQYLLMRTGEVLLLVRDGKTGRVITAPPDEHLWTFRKKQGVGRASKHEWCNVLEIGLEYFDRTEELREWRFGFSDYYDVFIWDFVPGRSPTTMYNVIITVSSSGTASEMCDANAVSQELRHSWRIAEPRDVYKHMAPLLQTLTRDKDTMRTRKIRPGEDVKTLWDTLMDDQIRFLSVDMRGKSVTHRDSTDLRSPYMFYNAANAAEDKVLFPDESDYDRKKVPFRELKNGVNGMENGFLPSVARELAKGLVALRERDPSFQALEEDNDEDNIWVLPKIWDTGLMEARRENPKGERLELLKRTGLERFKKKPPRERIRDVDEMESMERDRSRGEKLRLHCQAMTDTCR
jgi:hypothetical protein